MLPMMESYIKKLKRNVALRSILTAPEDSANNNATVAPATAANIEAEENDLRPLEEFRNKEFVEKLAKA